jgi:glycosyltransferase involved in cell wall biosynthesis
LDNFHRQTLPPDSFEVVVVVDGSTDDTVRMLARIETPFRLAVVEQRNQGAAAARNAGVAVAHGTYCAFVDDDIVAAPELLAEHLRVQCQHRGVVGLGAIPTVVPDDAGWLPRCVAEDFNEHYAKLASGARTPSWQDCYGGNLSVPRALFLAVGGFATEMWRGHDVELGFRLSELGLSFVHIPTAVGTQELSKRPRELLSDFEYYGVNAAEIYRRHPQTRRLVFRDFYQLGGGPVWLRRLLLASGISPQLLGIIGSLSGSNRWHRAWFRLIRSHCYWRGVQRALLATLGCWLLTHDTPVQHLSMWIV